MGLTEEMLVVGHHGPTDPVGRRQVERLPGQGHLDAGGAPGDEVGQLPFRILCRLLCTWGGHRNGGGSLSSTPVGSGGRTKGASPAWVGSTSPWMMLRMLAEI